MPAIIGFMSHLVLDAISGGIRPFWPLKFRLSIPLFKTMGLRELIIALPALFALNIWAIEHFVGIKNFGSIIASDTNQLIRQVLETIAK